MAKKHTRSVKQLAVDRIRHLFSQAAAIFSTSPEKANRYVHLSRKLAMKAKVRMPRHLKRRYCKHCYAYLVSGENARVRTKKGHLVTYCKICKKYTKVALK